MAPRPGTAKNPALAAGTVGELYATGGFTGQQRELFRELARSYQQMPQGGIPT